MKCSYQVPHNVIRHIIESIYRARSEQWRSLNVLSEYKNLMRLNSSRKGTHRRWILTNAERIEQLKTSDALNLSKY